jgi:hypothetical protein
MVGGVVINIVRLSDCAWVQCEDTTYYYDKAGRRKKSYTDHCAIRVKDPKEMKVGDRLWWQGSRAMWTPKPDDGREDIVLERVGYSHSKIPNDVLEAMVA